MEKTKKENLIDEIVTPGAIKQIDSLIEKLKIADELQQSIYNNHLHKTEILSNALLSLPKDSINWTIQTRETNDVILNKIQSLIQQI